MLKSQEVIIIIIVIIEIFSIQILLYLTHIVSSLNLHTNSVQ